MGDLQIALWVLSFLSATVYLYNYWVRRKDECRATRDSKSSDKQPKD